MQQPDDLPDLDALAAFIAVAEGGSFATAGRRLGRDPTAVSRRLQALEAGLGVRLVERSTRHVALTEAGRAYLDHVRPLLQGLQAAGREASAHADGEPRGRLRLALPGTFGRMWLVPLLVEFRATHPAVSLDVSFSNRFVDLIGEGFDLAVRLGVLADSRLVVRKVADRRRLLCAAPAYLERHGAPATPEDLAHRPCLVFSGRTNPYLWEFVSPAGSPLAVPVTAVLAADDAEALVHAAVAGQGLLYATDWLVGRELADGRLVPVLTDWPVPDEGAIYLVMPSARHVPSKTRAFADWIGALLSRNPPWRSP